MYDEPSQHFSMWHFSWQFLDVSQNVDFGVIVVRGKLNNKFSEFCCKLFDSCWLWVQSNLTSILAPCGQYQNKYVYCQDREYISPNKMSLINSTWEIIAELQNWRSSVVQVKFLNIFKNFKNTFCECQISGSWFCGGNTWIYYNSVLVCTTPKTFTLINFLLIFINLVLIASINTFVWTKSYLVIVVTETLSSYWRSQDDDVYYCWIR